MITDMDQEKTSERASKERKTNRERTDIEQAMSY